MHAALHARRASKRGHVDVVRALLEGGATIDHTDGRGYTALLIAVREGKGEAVRALLACARAETTAQTSLRSCRSAFKSSCDVARRPATHSCSVGTRGSMSFARSNA